MTVPRSPKDDPVVSVIIPAWNAAGCIGETVASALAQTWRELEVIVIDDGSTDGTAARVAEMATADPRLRMISQPNQGVAAARNRGLSLARGRFIALLDADDLWHPEKIARQMAVMRAGGGRLGLVYCRYREIDGRGRVLGTPALPAFEGDVFARLLLVNFMGGGSAALMRREHLAAAGGFDPDLRARGAQGAEDSKLFLALAERAEVGLAPGFLMGYRRSGDSMSCDSDAMLRSTLLVLDEARRRHPELPARLFRWAHGECGAWLGTEALYAGRLLAGLGLLARTLAVDPPALFRPRTAHALTIALRRALRPQRPGMTVPERTAPPAPHFLDLSPDEGLPVHAPRPAPRQHITARCEVAARWRVVPARPQGAGAVSHAE